MDHSKLLTRALIAGASDLRRRSTLLDAINVFPVMDGDTGKNMTATLGTLFEHEDRLAESKLSVFCETLSEPILYRAQGNSGIILAQFLVGFIQGISKSDALSFHHFIDAIQDGQGAAFRSVAEPKQGTILTVMEALVRILTQIGKDVSLSEHGKIEQELAQVVCDTTEQLPELAAAGVVDSGALGFSIFSSGLLLCLPALNGDERAVETIVGRVDGKNSAPIGDIEAVIRSEYRQAAVEDHQQFRYCVNLLVERNTEREVSFQNFGSSINTIISGNLMKLHIHTDDPEAVKREAASHGRIIDCVKQDMSEALVRASKEDSFSILPHRKYRIVADSSMSLSEDLQKEWGISRIDNFVIAGGRSIRDSEIVIDELYGRMRDGERFSTAQISEDVVREFFSEQLEIADCLIFTAVGHAYTGTQKTVRQAWENHPEKARIIILDTMAASGQQGLVALAAAHYAHQTDSLEALVAYVETQIANCREYLVIDDLSYLKRSGRIGKIKSAFASALGIKPVVGHSASGAVTYAKPRSHEAAVEEIVKRITVHPGDGPLMILVEYTDNRAWVEDISRRLLDSVSAQSEIFFAPLSSSSAVHMGPGTWGVAVTRRHYS